MATLSVFGALALGFCLHTGAGCMSPTVIRTDATQVILKYGPWDADDELQRLAQSFCERHGKLAQRLHASAHTDTNSSAANSSAASEEALFHMAYFACLDTSASQREKG